ncbi:MAG: STAS/SEC14 domain-containing protein [Nitriliruptor sp.]|nr:MAG: STAS/SEC14 domain-containing protein [Nitriliruptor sp.]
MEGTSMMRRLEKSHDKVIGYSLSGEVTDDEYTQLASELRDEIAKHDAIRVLFRLSDLKLSSFFTALDERLSFLRENRDDVERVAVVTDDTATQLLSKAAQAGPVELQTFSSDDESKAWAWLE